MAVLIDSKNSFSIGGVKFQAQKMKYNWESIAAEDSGRTLDGVMHIYWVLRKIRKIEIVMPPCDSATISRLIGLVQGKEYNLTYWDPEIQSTRTIYCYTSNANGDLYSGIVHNGLWQGFEFHAIELGGTS